MTKEKKQPQRRCIGCGERRDKRELIRIVRSPDGEVSIDPTGKKSGRGAYICKSRECLRRALKTNQLARNLSCEIPEGVAETLLLEIEKCEGTCEE